MTVVTLGELLDAGVHFGHQASRWNPKMFPYIYAERNGIIQVPEGWRMFENLGTSQD